MEKQKQWIVPLRQDFIAALGKDPEKYLDVLRELLCDTINVTCTVYLRTQCYNCMVMRSLEPYFQWINEKGYKHLVDDTDFPQLMRQTVIWTKEYIEEQMLHPCSRDMESSATH